MKKRSNFIYFMISLSFVFWISSCTPASTPVSDESLQVSPSPLPPETRTADTPVAIEASNPLAEVEEQVGYAVKTPADILSKGYVLESATVDQPTQSVCLQYRYPSASGDSVLFIALGPLESAPPLELIPDLPDYLAVREEVAIGGAANSYHVSGWKRSAWACTEAAAQEKTSFSYAVAPWLTWEAEQKQFDLYSASGGCSTPGGLTNLDLLRIAESLTGSSTHPTGEPDPDCLQTVDDASKLAGFTVKMPSYLPEDVSFYYATYAGEPAPTATQLFIHEQHRDMGRFFQISQFEEAPPYFLKSCDGKGSNACEVIQSGNTQMVYQSTGASEQLDWQVGDIYFSLFRSAGEPGKVYKDELLKVAESMR